MSSGAVDGRSSRRVLTFGRVDFLRVQVGYRVGPEGPAYEHFLLDLPVPEPDRDGAPGLDEDRLLAALDPVVFVGADAPRHYPSRHEQVFNVLYCDGHVGTQTQGALQLPWFYAE